MLVDIGNKEPVVQEFVERTDPFLGEFSPSGIGTAACLRRFYYEKILKLKGSGASSALIFGTAIHKAMETYHALKPQNLPLSELQHAVVRSFVEEWAKYNIVGDSKRNLDSGMLILNKYCEVYQHDDSIFVEEDIESSQWMPMPNGTRLLVKMDRVLVSENIIRLVDTKTTSSSLTDYYFKKYENDLKMSLYFMVVENLLGRCDDMMIDAIKVPLPIKDPSTGFARRCFSRTELQIQDALNTYAKITDYIMIALKMPQENWAELFFCNQEECDKYSGCKYLSICKHGLDHPSVVADFGIDMGE